MVKHISNFGVCAFAAILTLAFAPSGCSIITPPKFILVDSKVVETTRSDSVEAEVIKTPRYSQMVSQIKSVALSAPSSCANQSAASATGSAANTGDVVKTLCGVEMAEIERALVRQGFTVYSWNMVSSAINANITKNAAAVAKALGAQVLFQVNSLERVTVNPGRDSRIERSFLKSNAFGESLSPLELDDSQINKIKAVTTGDEAKRFRSIVRLGAMLDINAVDSETGQTIWFYRGSKQEDSSRNVFASFLLQCWDSWGPWCLKAEPQRHNNPQQTPEKPSAEVRSTEVETVSIDPRPASKQDTTYSALLRDVTADFVNRFKSGQ